MTFLRRLLLKVRVLNQPQSAGIYVYALGILTLQFKQCLLSILWDGEEV